MEIESLKFYGSTQLILVAVAIFGAFLGLTSVFTSSKEDREFYYPNWRSAIGFYVILFCEVIYVAQQFSPQSLRFVNTIGLLLPLSLAIISWERFFFFKRASLSMLLLAALPFLALAPMFIDIIAPNRVSPYIMEHMSNIVNAIFIINIICFFIYQYHCKYRKIEEYKMEYSNISDFPQTFANQMLIALFIWVSLHAISYYSNQQFTKAIIDIIRICIGISITIVWIGKNRTKKIIVDEFEMPEFTIQANTESDYNAQLLLKKIHELLINEQLYLNPELRLSDIQAKLFTNRTYLSRAINSVPGQSFYSLILEYRINHAKELLINNPDIKLDDVAFLSGFSSRSYFSKTFKAELGVSPSDYRKNIIIKAAT